MPRLKISIVFATLAAVVALLHAWPAAASADRVVVFAAASLKNALDAAAAEWRRETGKEAVISYAASSTLAKQIENGAPADLFISADEEWMDHVAARGLLDAGSRVDLIGNTLVLVAPKTSSASVTIAEGFPLATLLGDGRLAMADPAAVPAGKYGKAALTKLGVWDKVAGRIAAAENVRAAVALVARGEAPLGIVYATDAHAERGVRIVAVFPAGTHPAITYPLALTKSAGPNAADFVAYLQTASARTFFQEHGFRVLDRER